MRASKLRNRGAVGQSSFEERGPGKSIAQALLENGIGCANGLWHNFAAFAASSCSLRADSFGYFGALSCVEASFLDSSTPFLQAACIGFSVLAHLVKAVMASSKCEAFWLANPRR